MHHGVKGMKWGVRKARDKSKGDTRSSGGGGGVEADYISEMDENTLNDMITGAGLSELVTVSYNKEKGKYQFIYVDKGGTKHVYDANRKGFESVRGEVLKNVGIKSGQEAHGIGKSREKKTTHVEYKVEARPGKFPKVTASMVKNKGAVVKKRERVSPYQQAPLSERVDKILNSPANRKRRQAEQDKQRKTSLLLLEAIKKKKKRGRK